MIEDLIVAQVCGGNLPGIKRSCASADLRGVVIALCDLGPAFGVFVGQHGFVVRTVFPFDGDHVAVVAGVPFRRTDEVSGDPKAKCDNLIVFRLKLLVMMHSLTKSFQAGAGSGTPWTQENR